MLRLGVDDMRNRRGRAKGAPEADNPIKSASPASIDASSHPRHLRHFHGRHRAPRARGGAPRHRLRRQRLSADEHINSLPQGIELIEGWNADQIALETRRIRDRQRGHTRQSADGGDPRPRIAIHLRPAMAEGERPRRKMGGCGGRHPWQDHVAAMVAWILEHAGLEPGFLIGGIPANFGVSARLNTQAGSYLRGGSR